ncbi:MAG: ATP-binding cassette domain-containing protein [Actinomycetaceae bacterium]|nr:ATP-binding cassette domain-containing protein [Actinomycetaceae bacterium]MDU0970986.1 ATP-binding cassette domain-containing protein [Actinomycetaceae bacterium]
MRRDEVAAPLEVDDLHVTLGSTPILTGISFTVHAGETVALMGPNGSGKSTLVKAIVGINPIHKGRVLFFGEEHPARRALSRVGYVPQRIHAGGGVPSTALEVVRSGLLGPGRLFSRPGDKAKAMAALERVGLADRANQTVQTFSGGQAQRCLIARALVREPELLIMDEPLAGIDATAKDQLADTVAQMKGEGVTMLIVLHETGTLTPLLDYAVSLQAGQIVSIGAPPEPEPGHDRPDHDHVHPHTDPRGPAITPDLKD